MSKFTKATRLMERDGYHLRYRMANRMVKRTLRECDAKRRKINGNEVVKATVYTG